MNPPWTRPLLATLLALGAGALISPGGVASSASLNPIQVENALPGTTQWRLDAPAWGGGIQGYASRPSVRAGQTISFSVSSTRKLFFAEIYRMGWYGGKGGRLVKSIPENPYANPNGWMAGHKQPVPKPQAKTGLVICGWKPSFSVTIPATWVSGVYMVKLTSSYPSVEAYIPFVVTDPASQSPLLFVHGLFTDQAYNNWGGRSLYTTPRAVEVGFHRPLVQSVGAGWFFSWEYHMVRWMEHRGYDVSYATDLDVHQHPGLLRGHHGLVVAGHDAFWTRPMRNGYQAAVAHGVGFGDFAAGTGLWQARLLPHRGLPNQVLVSYRSNADPIRKTNKALVTTEWRFPPVNRPESMLTGAMYGGYEGNRGPVSWRVSDARSWIFHHTGAHAGDAIPGVVGPEFDRVDPFFPKPHGLRVVSKSTAWNNDTGHWSHAQATVYRSAGGAWVFDAGTMDWSWGLDATRDPSWLYNPVPKHPSALAQKITANVLNRLSRAPGLAGCYCA